MLAALGHDLAGAIRAVPSDSDPTASRRQDILPPQDTKYRFSLAGVQLKFSAMKNRGQKRGLTIPVAAKAGAGSSNCPRHACQKCRRMNLR